MGNQYALLSRRQAMTHMGQTTLGAAAGLASAGLWGCGAKHESPSQAQQRVVLYSSVDDFVLRDVVERFEAATGIAVDVLGDTEAVKTTGLVARLLTEKDAPRADVWWSSEPFGSEKLAQAGVLEAVDMALPKPRIEGASERLVGTDGTWYGIALRSRVLGVRRGRFTNDAAPTRLRDLVDTKFRGRVGMARPAFGTTRGHMAALALRWGGEVFEAWLSAMKANGLKLYDSNSAVVRALGQGELDVGLTDTDDVWAAQRNAWPVDAVFEAVDDDEDTSAKSSGKWPSFGPMLIAGTVGKVHNSAHAAAANELMKFLILGQAESILADSVMHTIPVWHDRLLNQHSGMPYAIPGGWLPDVGKVVAVMDDAMTRCQRVLG